MHGQSKIIEYSQAGANKAEPASESEPRAPAIQGQIT